MLFLPERKIGTDGLHYRPDEEMPWGRFLMSRDSVDPSDGDDRTLILLPPVRNLLLYGFLAGLAGALAAALTGLALSSSWPIGAWALAGTALVSATAWLAFGRRL